ncbi:SitI3 family protein [Streptomyces sp. NPDC086182]|uniref:SitI3 family protein n=1 Tax=Streptomyces sp. NPDC086182 TaxID=3155058 RepID=UPI00343C7BA2
MAIEYDLDIATRSPASEVASRLAEIGRDSGVFDESITGAPLTEKGVFAYTRRGTCVTVIQQRQPRPGDPIVTKFGFTPTVGVGFRMGRGTDTSNQQDDMIRLMTPLLDRVEGDAVLHYQFEVIWLLRKNGDLSLDERDDLWRPERLALVTRPYRRETHIMDTD